MGSGIARLISHLVSTEGVIIIVIILSIVAYAMYKNGDCSHDFNRGSSHIYG